MKLNLKTYELNRTALLLEVIASVQEHHMILGVLL